MPGALQPVDAAECVIDTNREGAPVGSVIKKRRKRMSKKKHRKLLRRTRMQRRKQGK